MNMRRNPLKTQGSYYNAEKFTGTPTIAMQEKQNNMRTNTRTCEERPATERSIFTHSYPPHFR